MVVCNLMRLKGACNVDVYSHTGDIQMDGGELHKETLYYFIVVSKFHIYFEILALFSCEIREVLYRLKAKKIRNRFIQRAFRQNANWSQCHVTLCDSHELNYM